MQTTVITSLNYEEFRTLISETIRAELKQIAPPPRHDDMPSEAGQLISKKSAARLLECSAGTVDNAARAGRLKRHYVGRSVRFDRAEVLGLAGRRTK